MPRMKPTTALALAFLLFLVGAAFSQTGQRPPTTPQPIQTNMQQPAANNIARFQIVMSPLARADEFLLDTQTGRIWQLTKITDLQGEPTVWMYQTRVDNDAEFLRWSATQTVSAPK